MASVAISCVIESKPKYIMQAWNWLCSLKGTGAFDRANIYIHSIGNISVDCRRLFERMGANVISIKPYSGSTSKAAVYCNKLQQFNSENLSEYDYVVLSDADLVFSSCPTLYAHGDFIRAKQVDLPNPPEKVLQWFVDRLDTKLPISFVPVDLAPQQRTLHANCNGGLYIIPGHIFHDLGHLWTKWANFFLCSGDILGKWAHHADQLGFALAVIDGGFQFKYLSIDANFPTHLQKDILARIPPCQIRGFHYHDHWDSHGLPLGTGVKWIDNQLNDLNGRIRKIRRSFFSNQIFWDFRYWKDLELGSGLGSRGDNLRKKRKLLEPFCRLFFNRPILDIGCGDLEVTRFMPAKKYHGIDICLEALRISAEKRPEWKFSDIELGKIPDSSYDLVLCLDVLIHQPSPEEFQYVLENAIRISRNAIIVSGYDSNLNIQKGIIFSHRRLRDVLAGDPRVANVEYIGHYRDVEVYIVIKKSALAANPHDISIRSAALACAQTSDWELLVNLINESRKVLGFFPATMARAVEYPWFAKRLLRHRGERVLDVGAGVSVLPCWLASKGVIVETIDSHQTVRELANKQHWNEWGFLDYSLLDNKIISHHGDVCHFSPENKYEAIYSVSVLEHVHSMHRRKIIAKMVSMIPPGGRVYLSLDLVPGKDDIWPLAEGRIIESEGNHGTWHDIIRELNAEGMLIVETSIRRGIMGSQTDLILIEATKTYPKAYPESVNGKAAE
ncbi:MAG: methyltransferase domain-containing protein [Desulfacinum sp.]|jgi:2-polyprenyl-3-methyl-5-hydroxy-6-metoxy-1,4-benzoquinol methylase|nr:methyltransferase domain-containing protein [Desulfacinum sp.]